MFRIGRIGRTGACIAFALGMVLVLLLLPIDAAHACGNAVMLSENESIAKLREAEAALDEGDVLTARELASSTVRANRYGENGENHIYDRAMRILALSYVRDPSATPESIDRAVEILDQRVKELRNNPEPALAADYGETLERAHRDEEVLTTLRPLAERDLIGSAYAYAALSRAAGRRGDITLSTMSSAKCRALATNPRMCSGFYPPPPLLRGTPLGYALPGFVFLGAAALLLHARRKQNPKSSIAPWLGFRARFFAGVIAIAALASFMNANARNVWFAVILAFLVVLVVPVWQRRAFLASARHGRAPGFHIRAVEEVDANTPLIRLFFGPAVPETLERLADPSYRESARSPVLRVGRRSLRLVWIAVAILVGLLFAGCASMMFLSRSASSSVVHDSIFAPQE